MNRVLVLMSTYNGEKYIREQLDSLYNQKNIEIHLLVRDDGSSDSTVDIINEYKQKMDIELYSGANLKSARSFMDLIFNAPENYEYYALCDQDDYWLEDKLSNALTELEYIHGKPALYYCGMSVVDKDLKQYDYYFRSEKYSKSLYMSSLFGDEIAGCTMVFNNELLMHLKEYDPKFITLHDGWIHRVCLCVHGKVISNKESFILYRQHECNVEGMKRIPLRNRIKNLYSQKKYFSRLAGEMLNGYEKYLENDERIFLYKLSNQAAVMNRIFTAFYNKNVKMEIKERIILVIKVFYGSF